MIKFFLIFFALYSYFLFAMSCDEYDPNWEEEESDRVLLAAGGGRNQVEDDRERRNHRSAPNDDDNDDEGGRDRSPLRGGPRSSVHFADSNIDARIQRALDEKLSSFLGKVKEVVNSKAKEDEAEGQLSGQMESLQLGQKEIRRRQLASSMKTDGGKFQFLALSEIKAKVESAQHMVNSACKKSFTMSSTQMLELAGELDKAHSLLDKRMDLVYRADSVPNGFRVLTAYQKRLQEADFGSNPENEKLWGEMVKQVEKEKKDNEPKGKKGPQAYYRGGRGIYLLRLIFLFVIFVSL